MGFSQEYKVGLLGGSFNPAHEGHLYISMQAMRRLDLDSVWWLVAPQNPLKSADGMAALAKRTENAQKITRNYRNITVNNFETKENLQYSYDTIKALKKQNSERKFVWLMGADCLEEFHLWQNWRDILHELPIAIFPRQSYNHKALTSITATEFADRRVENPAELLSTKKPAWCYLRMKQKDISSTEIRNASQLVAGK